MGNSLKRKNIKRKLSFSFHMGDGHPRENEKKIGTFFLIRFVPNSHE
jgi:hypothetical protein